MSAQANQSMISCRLTPRRLSLRFSIELATPDLFCKRDRRHRLEWRRLQLVGGWPRKHQNPQAEACATKTSLNRSIFREEDNKISSRLLPIRLEIWANDMNASPTPRAASTIAADAAFMD